MPVTRGPVLVLGATSGIARAVALQLGLRGHSLCLAGRDDPELQRVASDLRVRADVDVWTGVFDADQTETHKQFFDWMVEQCGVFQGVVLAFGHLGDQDRANEDWVEAQTILDRNFLDAASMLHVSANFLEKQGEGWIVALSSVAGDRGRMSNYWYGSAKGGLTVLLQGLRARLQKSNVHVMTVKPGPVDTGMTFGMDRLPLLADPESVGVQIVEGLAKGKDVVYVPGPWRLIMFVLRSVPERVFKKTRL